jgi:hypothetical protein
VKITRVLIALVITILCARIAGSFVHATLVFLFAFDVYPSKVMEQSPTQIITNAVVEAAASIVVVFLPIVQTHSGSSAQPEKEEFKLVATVIGSGTVIVSPNQIKYTKGQVVTISVIAAPGWQFAGWSDDLSDSHNPATLSIDSNRFVTATFIQIDSTPISGVTPSVTPTRTPISTSTFTPTPSVLAPTSTATPTATSTPTFVTPTATSTPTSTDTPQPPVQSLTLKVSFQHRNNSDGKLQNIPIKIVIKDLFDNQILFTTDWLAVTPANGPGENWGTTTVDVSSAGLTAGQSYQVFVTGAMHPARRVAILLAEGSIIDYTDLSLNPNGPLWACDVNQDNQVTQSDVDIVITYIASGDKVPTIPDPFSEVYRGDQDVDRLIDITDFNLCLSNKGKVGDN